MSSKWNYLRRGQNLVFHGKSYIYIHLRYWISKMHTCSSLMIPLFHLKRAFGWNSPKKYRKQRFYYLLWCKYLLSNMDVHRLSAYYNVYIITILNADYSCIPTLWTHSFRQLSSLSSSKDLLHHVFHSLTTLLQKILTLNTQGQLYLSATTSTTI